MVIQIGERLKFLVCPSCERRMVYYKAKKMRQSNYRCKHWGCRWYAFTSGGTDQDRERLEDLRRLNPEAIESEDYPAIQDG